MSYFEMFPSILYSAKGDGKFTVMKDILSRVKLITKVKENILGFDYYDVKDGETPEMIAHKYYGDVNLHWVVMVTNDIIDYYEDWPMSVQRFEQFVFDKYDNPQGIHHYEITQTSGDTSVTIDVGMNITDYPSATAISNYQYEDKLQEKKRQIRLITPEYIDDFVKEFERKMNESK
tara:strand:- start:1684 stop:2211 length:528 start_codon:yes stop_codon:yes gene_type:complete